MDKRETLRQVGKGVLNSALAGGLLYLLSHGAAEGRTTESASQVSPSPQGIVQELKGPMPSQLPITEQIEQVKVLQGPASQGETLQSPEQAEIKTDILIFETAYDPTNGLFWTTGRHPSKGDAMALYKGRYTEGKVLWQKITEFPWMGTLPGMVAVSPTEPNILTVAGGEQNQQGPGKILLSKDSGQNFQEITVPDMGAVNYVTFSKNGDKIYYSTNNFVATAGIVVKVNVSDNRREAAANNGLEGMQNFGGPILASPNSNETLYAVSGIAPQILKTTDGGQNWPILENLTSSPGSDGLRVASYQGKDVVAVAGGLGVMVKIEGQAPIWDYTGNFGSIAMDATDANPKIFGARGTSDLKVKNLNETGWRAFSSTDLPADRVVADLKVIVTPDSRKFLIGRVVGTSNSADSSGFWVYDLSQGETTGTWQQMSDGLEWKDPLPFKVYLPSLSKQYSGGW